jgi:hypothetical protein
MEGIKSPKTWTGQGQIEPCNFNYLNLLRKGKAELGCAPRRKGLNQLGVWKPNTRTNTTDFVVLHIGKIGQNSLPRLSNNGAQVGVFDRLNDFGLGNTVVFVGCFERSKRLAGCLCCGLHFFFGQALLSLTRTRGLGRRTSTTRQRDRKFILEFLEGL